MRRPAAAGVIWGVVGVLACVLAAWVGGEVAAYWVLVICGVAAAVEGHARRWGVVTVAAFAVTMAAFAAAVVVVLVLLPGG